MLSDETHNANFHYASRRAARSDAHRGSSFGNESVYTYKSVCRGAKGGRPQLVDGLECRQRIAVGRFRNAINATGWAHLEVETFGAYASADLQAYAAGVLEACVLTFFWYDRAPTHFRAKGR